MLDDGKPRIYDSRTDHDTAWEVRHSKRSDRIIPFYAYCNHSYCGDVRNMSIWTIYKLSAHLMGYMGYDTRDIIELEVPDDEVFRKVQKDNYKECLLLYLKKEWIVSILHFVDYVDETLCSEPCCVEPGAYYENKVYNKDTYRMCYSNDIVLTGNGYGDVIEYCMSPELIRNVTSAQSQEDYVQPAVFNTFVKYCYVLRHGLNIEDITSVDINIARIEMPKEFNKSLIKSFNICKSMLCRMEGVQIMDNNLSYEERCKLMRKQ